MLGPLPLPSRFCLCFIEAARERQGTKAEDKEPAIRWSLHSYRPSQPPEHQGLARMTGTPSLPSPPPPCSQLCLPLFPGTCSQQSSACVASGLRANSPPGTARGLLSCRSLLLSSARSESSVQRPERSVRFADSYRPGSEAILTNLESRPPFGTFVLKSLLLIDALN